MAGGDTLGKVRVLVIADDGNAGTGWFKVVLESLLDVC